MTQNMPQKQKTKLVPVLREPALLTERDADKSPVLECIDLGITFGGLKAVDNFNVTIGRTEISGLIGPNGAGKTTVFNLLTKVYQPTHGTILLNGKDIHDLNTAQVNRAGIARTFQNIRLFGEMSVEQNITVAMDNQMHYRMPEGILRLPRFWKEERVMHERAMELLSIFHMEHLADAKASSLPYGAQRRLEILRALATNPSLLLLDEPAAGMNPSETAELMENICSIRDTFWLISRIASTAASVAFFIPLRRTIGFAPAARFFIPSCTIACASTVAVVVPSPATSFVFAATSLISCAPMFSNASVSSISRIVCA